MSQNDYTIANQGFPGFRTDLNQALQAIATNNSGTSAPSTTFANMWWYDSANNILYIRNEDNDAWIKFAELDQTNDKFVLSGTLQLDDGTVSAPALTFNSDTNMGLYRGGSDILKFVTAGTDRVTIDASGLVGIGTAPSTRFHVYQATGNTALRVESAGTNAQASINLKNDARRYDVGINSSDAFFITDDTASSNRITITSAGNVGIGTTVPASPSGFGSASILHIKGPPSNDCSIVLEGLYGVGGRQEIGVSVGDLYFNRGAATGSMSTSMIIKASGNVLLGTASQFNAGFQCNLFNGTTNNGLVLKTTRSATGSTFIAFVNSSGAMIGQVNHNGSTTVQYLTSSDYRLKENVNYNFDATTRLKQLKPARFNFIEDGTDKVVDGFLAHEVSSIVPEAINGEKDAVKDVDNVVLNADGSVKNQSITQEDWIQGKEDGIYASDTTWVASKTIIDAQGIDQSKLVPLLVKTIQELEARITALEGA